MQKTLFKDHRQNGYREIFERYRRYASDMRRRITPLCSNQKMEIIDVHVILFMSDYRCFEIRKSGKKRDSWCESLYSRNYKKDIPSGFTQSLRFVHGGRYETPLGFDCFAGRKKDGNYEDISFARRKLYGDKCSGASSIYVPLFYFRHRKPSAAIIICSSQRRESKVIMMACSSILDLASYLWFFFTVIGRSIIAAMVPWAEIWTTAHSECRFRTRRRQ